MDKVHKTLQNSSVVFSLSTLTFWTPNSENRTRDTNKTFKTWIMPGWTGHFVFGKRMSVSLVTTPDPFKSWFSGCRVVSDDSDESGSWKPWKRQQIYIKMIRIQTYWYSAITNPHAPNDWEGLENVWSKIMIMTHDLSIASLLRLGGGLLFCAGIFPAYYALSQPYRAKTDGRFIMGAIVGVMANVIQCLALPFFNNFLRGVFKYFFIFTPIPGEMIQFDHHIFEMGWFNHQRVKPFLNQEIFGPAPPIFFNQSLKFAFGAFLTWA